jgi:hypothetical protein
MDRGRGKTSWFVILLGAAMSCGALAGPFEPLETIAAQARDFTDFLARPKLTQAYKAALQEYYGHDKFQCESFEDILAKLALLNKKVPGFGAELWRPQSLPSFSLYRSPATGAPRPEDRWDLVPAPRKLHVIWNDPSQRGCESEDCGKAEVTSPERWSVALPGSRAYR